MSTVTLSLRLMVAAAACAFAAGCSASTETDDVDGEADAVSSAHIMATLTPKTSEKADHKCQIKIGYLQVTIPGSTPEAAAAINKTLAAGSDPQELINEVDCRSEYTWDSTTSAIYNDRAVLSTQTNWTEYEAGAAHMNSNLSTHTFDLRTGKELTLANVLTAAGRNVVASACEASLVGVIDDAAQAKRTCAEAVTDRPDTSSTSFDGLIASYVVEKNGLRLLVTGLPSAAFAAGAEGVLVPWPQLTGKISNTLVKAIAKAAP